MSKNQKKFWKIYRTSYDRLNEGFLNFVKPRRDNTEKQVRWTENKAFNYNPPLNEQHQGMDTYASDRLIVIKC